MPDSSSFYIDPFYAEKTLAIHCSVVEPDTGEAYERDPRGTAQKAEAYLISSGIGDISYFGPEAEFFLFDDVKFSNSINKVSYEVDAEDASWNSTCNVCAQSPCREEVKEISVKRPHAITPRILAA